MTPALRIAVAEDEPLMRSYLYETLAMLGHEVVVAAKTGRELVGRCGAARPDLVITDIKMPDMDGLDAAEEIYRNEPVPIIVVSAHHDPQLIERAQHNHIVAYLVKPIKQDDLEPAIVIAMQRFAEFDALRREATGLREALEDRKTIERAKGVLMRVSNVDEQEAFRRLKKLATERRCKLVEIAQVILTADEALREPNKR